METLRQSISITGVFATRRTNLKTNSPFNALPNFRSVYLTILPAVIASSSVFGGGGISPNNFRKVVIEMAEIHNHFSALGCRDKISIMLP